jgi:hypothetical protein
MSTLQHTPQTTFRHRIWPVVAIVGAAAALTLALVAINGGSSSPNGSAASVSSRQSASWLDNVAAARSAIARGEPVAATPDVATQRDTLAATRNAVASRASAQSPQPEPEALVDARLRHPVPAGQR